jgi:hypothetical protein
MNNEIEQLRRENRKLWLAVVLLLIVGTVTYAMLISTRSAGAQTTFVPKTTVPTPMAKEPMIFPPIEYDHYYEGDLTIIVVDTIEEIRAICNLPLSPYLLACSKRNARSCVIHMVADSVMRTKGWTTGLLLRHEIGHCNGWSGKHEGERALSMPTTHWVPANERVK